ncbi:hypothetical protein [Paraburkholderia susongensis]|uniref:Uncharacterized protein n=1 Tax=Paraburkholderia susongensis TaxID=1515439 RepID=A0A1X7I5N1_9BURK|nr:hypothetical protein [Paraburkholderia susongensis]SMG09840.1 hypothetical protein SAMN06265784_101352 [Paraburkholderia susongensis]
MADFQTIEEIEAWIAKNGEKAFNDNIDLGNFAGRRLENARAYRDRENERRASDTLERQAVAAEGAAAAAAEQTVINKNALTISKWALAVAVFALFVSIFVPIFRK